MGVILDKIIAYESGEMDEQEIVDFFQWLSFCECLPIHHHRNKDRMPLV